MVGAIKLLKYQLLGYWRRVFAVRGGYDRSSFFIVLALLLSAYGYTILLGQTARSLSDGNTGTLKWLLAIVFFVWLVPAFEGLNASAKIDSFLYLPLTRTQFGFIRVANVFFVPATIIALAVSCAAVWPIIHAAHPVAGVFALIAYSLFAAFLLTTITRLLRIGVFRVLMLLLAVCWAIAVFGLKTEVSSGFLPGDLVAKIVSPAGDAFAMMLLIVFACTAFLIAALTATLSDPNRSTTNRRITPRSLSTIRLPVRFGELIKKDLFSGWKMLDSYFSLFVTIVYAAILLTTDMSFLSFGAALAVSAMMSSGLAFNSFGLETTAGIERLSLAPIEPADLFNAKNRSFWLLVLSQTIFLFPIVVYRFGVVYLAAAVLKTVAVSLLYTAWGNKLSVQFPFKMTFYEVSFGGSIPDMMMAVLLISLVAIVPEHFLPASASLVFMSNTALAIVSYTVYRLSIKRYAGKLPGEWENIARALS